MCQSDKQAYILHAKLMPYKRRIERAIEITSEALSPSQKPLLSFSAGKDSIVLLDIAIKAGFRGDLLFFNFGVCNDVVTPIDYIDFL